MKQDRTLERSRTKPPKSGRATQEIRKHVGRRPESAARSLKTEGEEKGAFGGQGWLPPGTIKTHIRVWDTEDDPMNPPPGGGKGQRTGSLSI